MSPREAKPILLCMLLLVFTSPVQAPAGDGDTLIEAVMYQDVDEVQRLLQSGVDVDHQETQNGATALMLACNYGLVDIASMLLDAGAGVNRRNKQGQTAIIGAARRSRDLVELLIGHGADALAATPRGTTGFTASIVGALHGYVSIDAARIFLDAGADVDESAGSGRTEGYTCLMAAAKNGRPDLVRFLLDNGADSNLRAADGSTALGLALESGDTETVALLKGAGAVE